MHKRKFLMAGATAVLVGGLLAVGTRAHVDYVKERQQSNREG